MSKFKLYEIEESLKLAECELTYLSDLIFFLKKANYCKFIPGAYAAIQAFYDDFEKELGKLKMSYEFECILLEGKEHESLTQKEEIKLEESQLEQIRNKCNEMRKKFVEINKLFLQRIDDVIEKEIKEYKFNIDELICLVEKSLSRSMPGGKEKIHLKNSLDLLAQNTRRLNPGFQVVIKQTAELAVTDVENKMTSCQLDMARAQVKSFYLSKLTETYGRVVNAVNFYFSGKNKLDMLCKDILSMRDKYNLTWYYYKTEKTVNSWQNDLNENDIQVENNDIDLIIDFLKENNHFFMAPFNAKMGHIFGLFRSWGLQNENKLSELSNGLKKHLDTNNLYKRFFSALLRLNANNSGPMRTLLEDENNAGLVALLKNQVDFPDPVIDDWDYYLAIGRRI